MDWSASALEPWLTVYINGSYKSQEPRSESAVRQGRKGKGNEEDEEKKRKKRKANHKGNSECGTWSLGHT